MIRVADPMGGATAEHAQGHGPKSRYPELLAHPSIAAGFAT